MPSIWYLNGLHCAPVTDACRTTWRAPRTRHPGGRSGHNERIAWGATNAGTDAQDLFLEQADPADPTRYLFDGGVRPVRERGPRRSG